MLSNIPPLYYFDKTVFSQESERIFSTNWQFAAFEYQLVNPNDFVAKRIAGVPVLIQNVKGQVKAFINVCSHRFSLLQTEPEGNRPLVCPYHGWSYDAEGIPTGIPKKPLFKDFSSEELCSMRLQQFTLEKCGAMYFLCLQPPVQSLKEYLGSFYDILASMSHAAGVLADVNKMSIQANWKIIVENTLESYHVNLIHANTFRKLGASGLKFEFSGLHSAWFADLKNKADDPKLAKVHKPFLNRPYIIDDYHHYLIYPNLLISTSYGISFNFSIVEPLSESETSFTSFVFLSKCDDDQNPVIPLYKESLVNFNRDVFKEDKDICQSVQLGVTATQQKGVLSLEEERVHAFQENYINQYNG